ncbi:MAG TPA: FAD-dependent oxidoreductase [Prolixibacteraceae bacterium]|jgi:glycine/D-amino acid oxidase-like deaminating enzyme
MKVDFIIVGQGLAGSLLAFELLRLHQSILVFDDPDQASASSVAAGIINPVVFRRMTKSWLVDTVFAQMESTYHEMEDLLSEKLYDPCQLLKILHEESAQRWNEKVHTNQLENYLEVSPDLNFRHRGIHSPFGAGHVVKAGRVDIHQLVSLFGGLLDRRNQLRKEKFNFEKLVTNPQGIIYKDVRAEKIIFCEGPAVSQNPWFTGLKFKHSKGELLEVRIPNLQLDEIISHEVFVMPLGDDRYKVGATYSWDNLSWNTSPEAREELLTKLKSLVSAPVEVITQKAGIRPTMHDRKPVLGLLPEHPQIGILNGLGSKGALLGPYFARQLAEYLTGHSGSIHPEVTIDRFFRKWKI